LGRHRQVPEQPRHRDAPSKPARPSGDLGRGGRTMTVENLLTRTFAEVTETTDYPSTPLATIAARSRAIRATRRRRVALVAAAAVVVVAGVSAAVLLQNDEDAPPQPAGPLIEVVPGSPPKVAYLDGDTFVSATGQRVTAPVFRQAETATPFDGDLVVAARPT